jgi:hypothetical protein
MKLDDLIEFLTQSTNNVLTHKSIKDLGEYQHHHEMYEKNSYDDYIFEGYTFHAIDGNVISIEITKYFEALKIPQNRDEIIKKYGESKKGFFSKETHLKYRMKNYGITFTIDGSLVVTKLVVTL